MELLWQTLRAGAGEEQKSELKKGLGGRPLKRRRETFSISSSKFFVTSCPIFQN
jgi:hypothetical protein